MAFVVITDDTDQVAFINQDQISYLSFVEDSGVDDKKRDAAGEEDDYQQGTPWGFIEFLQIIACGILWLCGRKMTEDDVDKFLLGPPGKWFIAPIDWAISKARNLRVTSSTRSLCGWCNP